MESARHPAIALQFANVTDIYQHCVIAAGKFNGSVDRQCLNLALGGIAQGPVSDCDGLRHCFSP
jgi:hypothetical protein